MHELELYYRPVTGDYRLYRQAYDSPIRAGTSLVDSTDTAKVYRNSENPTNRLKW